MTLQFNPYPLEPWLKRQESEQRPDLGQTVVNPLMEGLKTWAAYDLQRKKDAQDQKLKMLELFGAPTGENPMAVSGMVQSPQFPSDAPLMNPQPGALGNFVGLFEFKRAAGHFKNRPQPMLTETSQPATAPFDVNDPNTWIGNPNLTLKQKELFANVYKGRKDAGLTDAETRLKNAQAGYFENRPTETSPQALKPPAGFRWTADRNLEAIPGGPAELKQMQQSEKQNATIANMNEQADLVINKVDQALGLVGPLTTGLGSKLSAVPGTKAKDLDAVLTTIKANLGFNQLTEMRKNSPTGGALGQVSDRELALLTSAVASLDPAQSQDQIVKNLNEIKTHYNNWKLTVQGQIPPSYGSQQSSQPVSSPSISSKADYDALPSGSLYYWNGRQGRKP